MVKNSGLFSLYGTLPYMEGKGVSTPERTKIVVGYQERENCGAMNISSGVHPLGSYRSSRYRDRCCKKTGVARPRRARTGNFLYLYILPGRSSPINSGGGRITSTEVCTRACSTPSSAHVFMRKRRSKTPSHANLWVLSADRRFGKTTCQPDSPPTALVTRKGEGRGLSRATLTPGLINRWNFLSLSFFFIFMNIVLR